MPEKSKCPERFRCNKLCVFHTISTLLQVILFTLSIFIWVFSNKIYFDGAVSSSIAKELKDNFYAVPITDFNGENSFDEGNTSLRNLKEESLGINYVNFGSWQGTIKGCGKKNDAGSFSVRALDSGENCKSDEIFLDSIDPVNIGIYSGIKVSKKTVGKSYWQLLDQDGSIVFENEKCPNNKKSCGYIDTIKNKLCIEQDTNCPINYIKIDYTEPSDITNIKTIKGNGKNMYISNNPYQDENREKYIVGNFKIADEQICSIPNLYWSKYELYSLDGNINKFNSQCSLQGYTQIHQFDNTERYHKLDDIGIYDLYKENGIIDLIQNSELVNYGYTIDKYFRNDKKLHLYVRTFIGFNKTCLEVRTKSFQISQLEELESKHSISEDMVSWGSWARGLMSFSEILALISLSDILVNDSKFSQLFFINYIMSIIGNIANIWQTTKSNDYDDAYQDKFTCSDSVTNEIYDIMTSKIYESGRNIKITNYFIIGSLFCAICLFVLQIIKIRNIKKIEDEEKTKKAKEPMEPEEPKEPKELTVTS